MLTARTQADDIKEARSAGADGYITKPFEPEHLSERIERKLAIIAESQAEQE